MEALFFVELGQWISDTPVRWQTMWDAKEYTTQAFFLVNLLIALYVTSIPIRSAGKDITATNRAIMFVFGIGYIILTIVAYLQLVPTFSPYG